MTVRRIPRTLAALAGVLFLTAPRAAAGPIQWHYYSTTPPVYHRPPGFAGLSPVASSAAPLAFQSNEGEAVTITLLSATALSTGAWDRPADRFAYAQAHFIDDSNGLGGFVRPLLEARFSDAGGGTRRLEGFEFSEEYLRHTPHGFDAFIGGWGHRVFTIDRDSLTTRLSGDGATVYLDARVTVQAPEPATLALAGLGLAAVAWRRPGPFPERRMESPK